MWVRDNASLGFGGQNGEGQSSKSKERLLDCGAEMAGGYGGAGLKPLPPAWTLGYGGEEVSQVQLFRFVDSVASRPPRLKFFLALIHPREIQTL